MFELKPCPFCGGEAKFSLFLGKPCVTCTKCMGGVFPALGNTEEMAAHDWNRRVTMGKKITPYDSAREIYEYVQRNKDRLPDYWQDKGTNVCIMGMCAMIARGKYSSKEIAEFYECPIALVNEVRYAYKKTIRSMWDELDEVKELQSQLDAAKDAHSDSVDWGYVELIRRIFER